MSFEERQFDSDYYCIEITYTLPFLSKACYIRQKEVDDSVVFTKFSFSNDDQELPSPVLFAKIPFIQFMRKIYLFSDYARQNKCLSIVQERFAFPHRYIVKDAQDMTIGFIESKSLMFNRWWNILDNQGIEIGSLREIVEGNIAQGFKFGIQRRTFSFDFYFQNERVG